MKTNHLIALTTALLATTIVPAKAQELLTNSSFELGSWVDLGSGYDYLAPGATDMTGWTVLNNIIAWGHVPNGDGLGAADGDYFLDLTGPGAGPLGGITQNVSTTVGQLYTFSIALMTLNVPVTVQVDAGAASTQFTQSNAVWEAFDFSFTATSAVTPVTITGISGYNFVGVDHPTVTATPEPTSAALLGFGTLLLAAYRRRASA